jgi:hypothetical protein
MPAVGIEAVIAQLLLTRVDNANYGLPKAMPDRPFDPATAPNGYLVVSYHPNVTGARSVDMAVAERQGFLQINVVLPKGGGIITPGNVAAAIIMDWRQGTILVDAPTGRKVTIHGVPYQSGAIEDPTRTSYPVIIPWHSFAPG